jgi:hypothetical protein
MTNEHIKNKYIRGLLARELMGHRKVFWRSKQGDNPMTEKEYRRTKRIVSNSFSRVDLHLRRYPGAIESEDVSKLSVYKGFAGHV